MGRLCADPGEKHEPRVAISSSAEKHLRAVAYQPVAAGALATAQNTLCPLTQAAIEKRSFAIG
jgi:hypothetical protein